MEKGLRERFIDPCSPRPFCFLMRFCVFGQGVGSQRMTTFNNSEDDNAGDRASAVVKVEMLQYKAN